MANLNTHPSNTPDPSNDPEWVREKILLKLIAISRGSLYAGKKEGWVRYVELRRRGYVKGSVLYHVPTTRENLFRLADEQKRKRDEEEKRKRVQEDIAGEGGDQ